MTIHAATFTQEKYIPTYEQHQTTRRRRKAARIFQSAE
jgi:hypothetical protein